MGEPRGSTRSVLRIGFIVVSYGFIGFLLVLFVFIGFMVLFDVPKLSLFSHGFTSFSIRKNQTIENTNKTNEHIRKTNKTIENTNKQQ